MRLGWRVTSPVTSRIDNLQLGAVIDSANGAAPSCGSHSELKSRAKK